MSRRDGFDKLTPELALLPLDSFQFHYYVLARAIATPSTSHQSPNLLDFSNEEMAIFMRCGGRTARKIRKELLRKGLLKEEGGSVYVVRPDLSVLHNRPYNYTHILQFIAKHDDELLGFNDPTPRRTGKRQGGKSR